MTILRMKTAVPFLSIATLRGDDIAAFTLD